MLAGPAWRVSDTEVLISRACDPSLHEPNYAANLEVAEYINKKKANIPREAAMTIAKLANNRNPHVAILALALLDTLVPSCGYPFHLQISTKEFLNELVRRFPERPPPFPGPVMSRILELIHNWQEGICATSRWKDDLRNIREMHKLLTYKGYRFRDISRNSAPEPTANLKSADELEAEDRDAQSAKLQELIRRGTSKDLEEAQKLMKFLSGANPEAKPDYRSQALHEVEKIESKIVLLNEMLDNIDTSRGERPTAGDVYEQVAAILVSARPKLQKWVSDAEAEDPESLDTFLQINDQINLVLERYDAFKRGDYEAASQAVPAELQAPTSLIDFDDSAPSNPTSAAQKNDTDDLVGLFGSSTPAPSHNAANNNSIPSTFAAPSPFSGAASSSIAGSSFSPMRPNTMSPPPAIALPGTPAAGGAPPNYFSSNGSSTPTGPLHTGLGARAGNSPSLGTAATRPGQQSNPPPAQGKDPFADLAGLF